MPGQTPYRTPANKPAPKPTRVPSRLWWVTCPTCWKEGCPATPLTRGIVAMTALTGMGAFMWGLPVANVVMLAGLGACTFVVVWPLSRLL